MWEALNEMRTNEPMEEGKLSRFAAGLGLGAAAMMGGAKDAGAQTVANAPATQDVRGVVSPADSAKMVGQAGIEAGKQFSDMSNYLRTAQAGRQGGLRVVPGDSAKFVQQAQDDKATQIGVHNYAQRAQAQKPGGLQFKATNPITKESQHKKRYSLEEWMGMLEEAGYDVSEYSLWRPKESGAKSTGVMKDPKKPKTPPAEPTKPKKKLDELSPETLKSYINKAARSATANAHFAGRLDADPDIPDGDVQKAKAAKRLRGIRRATEKLPVEENDLNELSPETYARYTKAADAQVRDLSRRQDLGQVGDNELTVRSGKRERGVVNAIGLNARKVTNPTGRNAIEKAVEKDRAEKAQGEIEKTAFGPSGTADTLDNIKIKQQNAPNKLVYRDRENRGVTRALDENTVARLQQLAGINPTE
jgi:hypothetical protein